MTDLRPNSEIADGIHWIKDGYVNAYLIESSEDTLVTVDSGMNKKAANIVKYLKTELSSSLPEKVFLTHHHLDHMGGLHSLNNHFHPRKFAHKIDTEVIQGERSSPLPNNIFMKPVAWFFMKLISPKRVEGIELVEDGQKEGDFTIHHLPGHTMGSVGYLSNKSMFSGDAAVTNNGDITIGAKSFAENMDAVYQSFRKLGNINFDQILPGHGEPILEDASMRIKEAIEKYNLS